MNNEYGLLPRIWGPHMWKSLHCISFNYPMHPTNEQKKIYKSFFELVGHVLPCKACGTSYNELVSSGENQITEEVFNNKNTLTKWLYNLHMAVNKKLNVNYDLTYDEVCDRYESFRVKCDPSQEGCKMTLAMKSVSFCNAYKTDCNIIPFDIAITFADYAKKRNIDFSIIHDINNIHINKDIEYYKLKWDKRNKICDNIIKDMRQNGISPVETSGKYTGLPTLHELVLLSYLASNLTPQELIDISKLININKTRNRTFRFSS